VILGWKDDQYITHRSFSILDLAVVQDVVVGRTFEDCTIYGPAVLLPLDENTFEHNTFEANPDALFWELPEDRTQLIREIGLSDCAFRRCVFRRIGIAAKRVLIARFTDDVGD
jgi:hypothetical protein